MDQINWSIFSVAIALCSLLAGLYATMAARTRETIRDLQRQLDWHKHELAQQTQRYVALLEHRAQVSKPRDDVWDCDTGPPLSRRQEPRL